jgi:hypothetical protein
MTAAAYLGVFVTVAGSFLWLHLLRIVPASTAASVQYLQPIIGVASRRRPQSSVTISGCSSRRRHSRPMRAGAYDDVARQAGRATKPRVSGKALFLLTRN